jgi:hypothetical protein
MKLSERMMERHDNLAREWKMSRSHVAVEVAQMEESLRELREIMGAVNKISYRARATIKEISDQTRQK